MGSCRMGVGDDMHELCLSVCLSRPWDPPLFFPRGMKSTYVTNLRRNIGRKEKGRAACAVRFRDITGGKGKKAGLMLFLEGWGGVACTLG